MDHTALSLLYSYNNILYLKVFYSILIAQPCHRVSYLILHTWYFILFSICHQLHKHFSLSNEHYCYVLDILHETTCCVKIAFVNRLLQNKVTDLHLFGMSSFLSDTLFYLLTIFTRIDLLIDPFLLKLVSAVTDTVVIQRYLSVRSSLQQPTFFWAH